MSVFPNPYKPLPWPEFVKRPDVKNLPILEQKRIWLKEKFYHETFLTTQEFIKDNALHNLYSAHNSGGDPSGFVFNTRAELDEAINLWISNVFEARIQYGQINSWDVSKVTNMSGLFLNKSTFNDAILNWDVSNVTTMASMFSGATAFNQDCNAWVTSNVTDMNNMFLNATSYNQDMFNWDVSSVADFSNMFNGASSLNKPLGAWITTSATNMAGMFSGATSYDQAIVFDISGVTDMTNFLGTTGGASAVTLSQTNYQFFLVRASIRTLQSGVTLSGGNSTYASDAAISAKATLVGAPNNWTITDGGVENYAFDDLAELQTGVNLWISDNAAALVAYGPINTWDVSVVTDMTDLFKDKTTFNDDISNWNVSNTTVFFRMFSGATAFNQPLNSWNMSSATDIRFMFSGASSFNQALNSWDISSVTEMRSIFANATSFNKNVNSWDVSNVTNFSYVFYGASSFNQNLNFWGSRVANATTFNGMFTLAAAFNKDIGNWQTGNVTDMFQMFSGTSMDQDLSSWDVSQVSFLNEFFGATGGASAVTVSTANYSAILEGWSSQTVKSGITFGGGDSQYSAGAAATARGVLTGAPNNWIITDGGQA